LECELKLFGNISKVNENDDGTLTVSGIASSESIDSDGEIILADAIKNSIGDYMKFGALREMHQNIAAGTTLSMKVAEDGLTHIEALVVDPVSVKKVLAGVLKGFSIGGKVTKRSGQNRNIIEGLKLTEVSLVDRPANPDAMITLYKADIIGDEPEDDEVEVKEIGTPERTEEVAKSLYCIADLASVLNHAKYVQRTLALEETGSTIPDEIKEWISEGLEILNQMTQEELTPLMSQPTEGTMPQEVIEEMKKEKDKPEMEAKMKEDPKKKEDAKKEDAPKEEAPKDEMSQEQMVKEIHTMLKGMMEKMYAPIEEEKKKAESNDDLSKAAKENESLKDELAKTTKALVDLKNAENKGFTKAITIDKSEDGIVAKSDDGKPKSTLDLIKSIHQTGGNRFGF
jgi:phage head maturation protease